METIERTAAKDQECYGRKLEVQVTNTKIKTMWIIGRSEDRVKTILWDGSSRVTISTAYLNKKIR